MKQKLMHGQNNKEEVLYMKLDEVKSKLTGELKDAIKGKDLAAKAVISVVSAKVTAVAKEAELKGKELVDSDLIGVFSQELKQVRESLVEAEKAARAKENANTGVAVIPIEVKPVVIKSKKNVSLRQITGGQSVAIEREEDIDKFLKELKTKLIRELDKDTIVNLLM